MNNLISILLVLSCSILFAQQKQEFEEYALQDTNNLSSRKIVNIINSNSTSNSIIFGDSYIFSPEYAGAYPTATYLDSTRFVVVYQPGFYDRHGTAIVGTVTGNMITYGNPYVFSNRRPGRCYITTLDSDHFVIAWWDRNYGQNTYYHGKCVVGTVSGDNITFGAKYDFSNTVQILTSFYGPNISLTSLDSIRFAIAYQDYSNSDYGASKIGTVSGTIISFGPKYFFNSGCTHNINTTTLDTSHFVVAYFDCDTSLSYTAIIGVVSGSNITYNSEYAFFDGSGNSYSISNIDTSNFIIAYRDLSNNSQGESIFATISGPDHAISYSNTSAFGSERVSAISTTRLTNNQFVIAYWSSPSRDGTAIVGEIMGNNIIFGPESDFNQQGSMVIPSAVTLSEDRFVVAYQYHVSGTWAGDLWGKANVGFVIESPTITTIHSDTACSDSINIPISVKDMNNVTGFSLILNYDTLSLAYTGYQNFNTVLNDDSLSVTCINGGISMSWNSNTPVNISSDILIELLFTATDLYNQETEELIWDDTNSYYIDSIGDSLFTIFNSGQITIDPIPVDAGLITGADSICQGADEIIYQIDSIPNTNSYIWSLVPDIAGEIIGSDTIITIDFSDSFNGEAILSVYGSNTCGNGISSSLIIDVIAYPTSNAGYDDTICEGESYTLLGLASNCTHSYWNTFGDGNFDDRYILNATYSPGPTDIQNGYVDIVLFAYAISPCFGEVGDTMTLIIEQKPVVIVGEDIEICEGDSVLLSGYAENYTSIYWTTSGDGYFDNPELLTPTYYPDTIDLNSSMVFLTLTAFPNLPCLAEGADSLVLFFISPLSQPVTPEGPTIIDLDIIQTSEYTTSQVLNATVYNWDLYPSEAGIIESNDTVGIVIWESSYIGIDAYVSVNVSNDCGYSNSDSLSINISPVQITDNYNLDIIVYPNPTNNYLSITVKQKLIKEINIYNHINQKVLNNSNYSGIVDISKLETGIYIIEIITSENLIRQKVIKR